MSTSEKRRTETTIAFRVAPDEAALVEEKGARQGLSAGQYAKALCLSDIKAPLPMMRPGPPRDARLLRELVSHLGRVGNNLNQLARAANTPGLSVDRSALDEALSGLASLRDALVAALRIRDP